MFDGLIFLQQSEIATTRKSISGSLKPEQRYWEKLFRFSSKWAWSGCKPSKWMFWPFINAHSVPAESYIVKYFQIFDCSNRKQRRHFSNSVACNPLQKRKNGLDILCVEYRSRWPSEWRRLGKPVSPSFCNFQAEVLPVGLERESSRYSREWKWFWLDWSVFERALRYWRYIRTMRINIWWSCFVNKIINAMVAFYLSWSRGPTYVALEGMWKDGKVDKGCELISRYRGYEMVY